MAEPGERIRALERGATPRLTIAVAGATGVLGRSVVPRLLEAGHRVRALVRRAEDAARFTRTGSESVRGDLLDPPSLWRLVDDADVVLHLATAIPRDRSDRAGWAANDRVRRDGTRNLVAAAIRARVRRYVQQSVTFLYGPGDGLADEDEPLRPTEFLRSAADMEEAVRAADVRWCILRGGTFYGPGTGCEEAWLEAARAGTLRSPGDGTALVSLVHVTDFARAFVWAAELSPPGSIFNVVDDEPVPVAVLHRHVAALVGAADPPVGGTPEPSRGCTNARLRAASGWRPAYPTYRSGLGEAGPAHRG